MLAPLRPYHVTASCAANFHMEMEGGRRGCLLRYVDARFVISPGLGMLNNPSFDRRRDEFGADIWHGSRPVPCPHLLSIIIIAIAVCVLGDGSSLVTAYTERDHSSAVAVGCVTSSSSPSFFSRSHARFLFWLRSLSVCLDGSAC